MFFFYYYFLASPLALHFKDDLYSLRRCSYNVTNQSKWRRIDKDVPKCLVISRQLMMDQYTLHTIRLITNFDNFGNVPIFGSTLHKCSKYFKIM
jgi:hypothetical protein